MDVFGAATGSCRFCHDRFVGMDVAPDDPRGRGLPLNLTDTVGPGTVPHPGLLAPLMLFQGELLGIGETDLVCGREKPRMAKLQGLAVGEVERATCPGNCPVEAWTTSR
eukprot:Skav202288  [mRNA]  locus=scaffold3364:31375:33119:- [translate_table: standard]